VGERGEDAISAAVAGWRANGRSGARATAFGATLMGRLAHVERRCRHAEPIRDPRMAFGLWRMKFLLYEGAARPGMIRRLAVTVAA
jgi:hypothetical protein